MFLSFLKLAAFLIFTRDILIGGSAICDRLMRSLVVAGGREADKPLGLSSASLITGRSEWP